MDNRWWQNVLFQDFGLLSASFRLSFSHDSPRFYIFNLGANNDYHGALPKWLSSSRTLFEHTYPSISQVKTPTLNLAYTWDILGIYLGYTWDILGIYLGYTWDILGIYLATTWVTLGNYLATPIESSQRWLWFAELGCHFFVLRLDWVDGLIESSQRLIKEKMSGIKKILFALVFVKSQILFDNIH